MQNQSYEEKAEELLKKLKRPREEKPPVRPYFIEITGSPDSGKTTIIGILDQFFRRQGFRVFTPQEGAEFIRHIPRTTPLYNVRTALYALINLIDASVNANYDLVIFDRCLCDPCGWMMYWEDKKKLTTAEASVIREFFRFPIWFDMIDAVFFVVTTVEEAMKRDKAASLTGKSGETTNPKSVEKLIEIFTETFNEMEGDKNEKKNLFLLNTSGLSRKKMAEEVLQIALSALSRRFEK